MVMYSALHIMQWFSWFLNFDESKQTLLTQDLKWLLVWCTCKVSTAYCNDWFKFSILWTSIPNKAELAQVIPVLPCASKHGCQRSSLLLYSIHLWFTQQAGKGKEIVYHPSLALWNSGTLTLTASMDTQLWDLPLLLPLVHAVARFSNYFQYIASFHIVFQLKYIFNYQFL